MLSLHLDLEDLAVPDWRWDTDQWRTRRSWVQPLNHPLLDHGLTQRPDGVNLWVRERTNTAGEFTMVRTRSGKVRIDVGPYGTAPIYLATTGPLLYASWDITVLAPYCRTPLDRAVVRALTRRHRYSTDTPFAGVYRLTERATATFTHAGLSIAYPPPAKHLLQPRVLREGSDPIDAFDRVLGGVLDRYPATGGVGIELSGGVDSANVALSVSRHTAQPISLGLIFRDTMGLAQVARRATIVQRFGLRDTTIKAHEHPPLQGEIRRRPHDPCADTYLEAFTHLAAAAVDCGIRVLCTGFGGDELLAPRPHERTQLSPTPPIVPWLGLRARAALDEIDANIAPVAPVPLPTLLSFAARNPTYLRYGIWPISPLADPLMVRFGESLPWAWRQRKRVARERLRRAGLPDRITNPTVPEHFLDLMQHGLRMHGLATARRMLTDGSILIDAGFVDPDAFTQALLNAENAATVPGVLYDTVATEMGLAAMMGG